MLHELQVPPSRRIPQAPLLWRTPEIAAAQTGPDGKVGERAGDGGCGLQVETGVGPAQHQLTCSIQMPLQGLIGHQLKIEMNEGVVRSPGTFYHGFHGFPFLIRAHPSNPWLNLLWPRDGRAVFFRAFMMGSAAAPSVLGIAAASAARIGAPADATPDDFRHRIFRTSPAFGEGAEQNTRGACAPHFSEIIELMAATPRGRSVGDPGR